MASSKLSDAVRFPAAALVWLAVLSGCSGAGSRPVPAADTTGAGMTVTLDSTARPTVDTTPTAPADTSTTPAPAPTPAQQDTSKATEQAQDTGTAQPQQADAPLRDAYHQAPRDTVTQEVYDGWKQFNLNCARCHGEDVLGTTIAPHLILSLKPDGPINTKELFVQTVCAGRPAKGMPAWCALGMDIPTIDKIYSYVKSRSDAKMGPGRPAVKREG
jgi:mono/diheme cytochrome c family protein